VRAQLLQAPAAIGQRPLRLSELGRPVPGPGEVRVAVSACACCRTDLHVVEGDLALPRLPLVPGHQVVGLVEALGPECRRLTMGQRVGVTWLHRACGRCPACRRGEENLCPDARFTGWTADGGYAEALVVPEDFAVVLPDMIDDTAVAPLLCAGAIGYRALRRAEVSPGERVALVGFGASAHLVLQVLRHWSCEVVVVTRGELHQAHALELGAAWAGPADRALDGEADRAVVFAPAGETVPLALRLVRPGGTVVLAGIHMTTIPAFDYSLLWGERSLRSVANVTRRDADELLALAATAGLRAETELFPLEEANEALTALAAGSLRGAAVLTVAPS
jgi:propanol-preferring alcohol dehydrogenase